ncbi:hypothetical protein LINPERHAP1_LOCUS4715 [Linum perenne]
MELGKRRQVVVDADRSCWLWRTATAAFKLLNKGGYLLSSVWVSKEGNLLWCGTNKGREFRFIESTPSVTRALIEMLIPEIVENRSFESDLGEGTWRR